MGLVKIRHIASGTVKDADSNVAEQLIEGGTYEAVVEKSGAEKHDGSKKSSGKNEGGKDASSNSGTGTDSKPEGA